MTSKTSTSSMSNKIREIDRSPHMSHRALTILLCAMCTVPVITIGALWAYLPKVHEQELSAAVEGANLPSPSTYTMPYDQRPELSQEGQLVVTNTGDQDWTQYNIQVNNQMLGSYQVYEHLVPIRAGESKAFDLSSFVSRSGAKFDLRYNPLRNVRIYARLPNSDRATYYHNFEKPSSDSQ